MTYAPGGDPPPIVAPSSPRGEQLMALARQLILILGPVAAFAAANHMLGLSSGLNLVIQVALPLASFVALILGQIKTRTDSEDKAKLANLVDDKIAIVK
jgi:hypothetical protein